MGHGGSAGVDSKVADTLLERFINRPHSSSTLTNGERVVVQLLAEGHSSKQIASVLKICQLLTDTLQQACRQIANVHWFSGWSPRAARRRPFAPVHAGTPVRNAHPR